MKNLTARVCKARYTLGCLALIISFFSSLSAPGLMVKAADVVFENTSVAKVPALAQVEPVWRDSGFSLPTQAQPVCFEPGQPDRLIFNQAGSSFSFNLLTGQTLKVSSHSTSACADEAGLLFYQDDTTQTTLRLSYNGFSEKVIPYSYQSYSQRWYRTAICYKE